MRLELLESDALVKYIYESLATGVDDRNHPYHLMSVASLDKDGNADVRMVVNRKFIEKTREIYFHTDYRSAKIDCIRNNPKLTLLFYNLETNIQLRIRALAQVNHKNDIAEKQWDATRLFSRKCYLIEKAPSTYSDIATDSLPEVFHKRNPTKEESVKGYENFCVVTCKITSIDYLNLAASGHLRALIEWNNNNDINFKWMIP